MKGKYKIIIQNSRVRFDFVIRRNITIIRGDSATGKTTLIDMLEQVLRNGDSSGIELRCKKQCVVVYQNDWQRVLQETKDSIVFIDECNRFVASEEFASMVKNSDNYYVIITRDNLPNLPHSVEEIYGIRRSGKYAGLKKTYNEFYRLYAGKAVESADGIDQVIVEDSNSGFDFFQEGLQPHIEKTQGSYLQYQKASLNRAYLHDKEFKQIKEALPERIQVLLKESVE